MRFSNDPAIAAPEFFVSAVQFMGRCVESSLESALVYRFLRRGHAVLTAAPVEIPYITLICYNTVLYTVVEH